MNANQLQLWDSHAHRYIVVAHEEPTADLARTLAANRGYTGWRVCAPTRELQPRRPAWLKHRDPGPSRCVAAVQEDYCNWAQRAGLKVIHAYNGQFVTLGTYRGCVRLITREAQFRVKEIKAADDIHEDLLA